MDCHDFMYTAKVRVRGERAALLGGVAWAKPLGTCNSNWQLVRTVSVCQSFWLLLLLLVACARGKPQHAEQRSAAQRSTGTHTLTPAAAAAATARSLLPAAVFAARSPSTNFHIVCLQLWAHQSNSTLFIRVCADKQTNSTQCTYRNTYLCIVHIIKKSSWLS